MKFEIWQAEGGCGLRSVPSWGRWNLLHLRKAVLLLRFEASTLKKAKQVYERFAFGGNPDRFIPLNEPAKKFLLPIYPCGFVAGDRVSFRKKYCVRIDGHFLRELPEGSKAKVLKGDVDLPEIVWLRLLGREKPYGNDHDIWISQEDACEFLERQESAAKVKRRRGPVKKVSK